MGYIYINSSEAHYISVSLIIQRQDEYCRNHHHQWEGVWRLVTEFLINCFDLLIVMDSCVMCRTTWTRVITHQVYSFILFFSSSHFVPCISPICTIFFPFARPQSPFLPFPHHSQLPFHSHRRVVSVSHKEFVGFFYTVGSDVTATSRLVNFLHDNQLLGTLTTCYEGGCGACIVVASVPDVESPGSKRTYSIHSVSI